jgi:ribosome maturation factor RimP
LAKVKVGGESFKGIIREVSGDEVTFEVNGERRSYPVASVQARLAEWPSEPR